MFNTTCFMCCHNPQLNKWWFANVSTVQVISSSILKWKLQNQVLSKSMFCLCMQGVLNSSVWFKVAISGWNMIVNFSDKQSRQELLVFGWRRCAGARSSTWRRTPSPCPSISTRSPPRRSRSSGQWSLCFILDLWPPYHFFHRGSVTHIELVGLALLHHGGLVLDLVVKAPGAVHGAVDGPPSAIAVLVARQLIGELPRQLEIIANNAAKTLFGRKICQKNLPGTTICKSKKW